MSDREPPERNRAAEEHVLGAILLEPERWPQVADLELANFAFPEHRAIFQSFAELAANGGIVSVEHVVEHLEKTGRLKIAGGAQAIQRLHDDTSTAATISHYADALRQHKHGPDKKTKRSSRAKPAPPATGVTVGQSGELFDDGSAYSQWQALGLVCNHNGQPLASLGNASLILERHPQLHGRIWLDTFRKQTWHSTAGAPARWTDIDALRLTQWVDQALKLPKISLETVSNAVALVAANHARNSVVDWLESLRWDGTARLDHWLEDCLGVAKTAFTMAVARNWLVSMVARAYRPGCQADHMPVLEGGSGTGKSSSLAILGGEWYRAAPQAFGSKEFIEVIQGAWLIEIPDMVGFGRREHTQIISAITTRSDPFRASYGRHAEDHPRTVIFAATSETDEYLQDTRGMRRYWPLVCTEIRRDILAGLREQLFAEAVVSFKAGATWHEVPKDEARTEQAQREQSDPWLEKVSDFVSGRTAVTAGEVASGIGLRAGEQTHAASIRIANCLKMLGFSQKLERAGNLVKRVYRRG